MKFLYAAPILVAMALACSHGSAQFSREASRPFPLERVVHQEAPWGESRSRAVRWSSDGRLFAVSTLMELQIRDGQTGAVRARVEEDINGYVFSLDGKQIAATLDNGDLLLIDLIQGTARRMQAPEKDLGCTWFEQRNCHLLISRDGTRLVVPVHQAALIWDISQGKVLRKIPRLDGRGLMTVAGEELIFEDQGSYRRIDLKSGVERGKIPGGGNRLKALSLTESPMGARLAAAFLGQVVILDPTTRQVLHRESPLQTDDVSDVTWAPGGATLAVTSEERVALWNGTGPIKVFPMDRTPGYLADTPRLTWSQDGTRLAVDCRDELLVFKTPGGDLLRKVPGEGAMAPDGKRAVVIYEENLSLIDLESGKVLMETLRRDRDPRPPVPFPNRKLSPEGDRLQLWSAVLDLGTLSFLSETVEVMDESDWKIPDLDDTESVRACSRPSPDGKEVVINQPCSNLRREECPCIYNLEAHRCRVPLTEVRGTVMRTWRFSPDGKLLSYRSSAYGSAVQIFDVASGKRVRILPGRANAQSWLSPDIIISVGPSLVPWLTRLSDGAVLRLLVRLGDKGPTRIAIGEGGRFEGDDALAQKVLRRQGQTILAPLLPLSQENHLRQPGLYRAFLSGHK